MSPLGRSWLLAMIALAFSVPALAQPKADAGSGPTNGATSTNDAGSGPTKGAKPNSDAAAASNSDSSQNRKQRWRHSGAKIYRRRAARNAGDA